MNIENMKSGIREKMMKTSLIKNTKTKVMAEMKLIKLKMNARLMIEKKV